MDFQHNTKEHTHILHMKSRNTFFLICQPRTAKAEQKKDLKHVLRTEEAGAVDKSGQTCLLRGTCLTSPVWP